MEVFLPYGGMSEVSWPPRRETSFGTYEATASSWSGCLPIISIGKYAAGSDISPSAFNFYHILQDNPRPCKSVNTGCLGHCKVARSLDWGTVLPYINSPVELTTEFWCGWKHLLINQHFLSELMCDFDLPLLELKMSNRSTSIAWKAAYHRSSRTYHPAFRPSPSCDNPWNKPCSPL